MRYLYFMSVAFPPEPPVPRLRPSPWLPIAGAIVGPTALPIEAGKLTITTIR